MDRRRLRHPQLHQPIDQPLQQECQHQPGEHWRQHAAQKEQHQEARRQEHDQIDGFLVGEVAVDPAADDLQKSHGAYFFSSRSE